MPAVKAIIEKQVMSDTEYAFSFPFLDRKPAKLMLGFDGTLMKKGRHFLKERIEVQINLI